jgi:outer membrane protein, heavy metal efflux system
MACPSSFRATAYTVTLGMFASGLYLSACTSVPPQPIDPSSTAKMLAARSLQDAEIVDALSRMGLSTERGWTLDALTVAAWSLRSDIAVATADVRAATATERVADLMPNPMFSLDPSIALTNVVDDPSPWVVGTALSFTIETGGKRQIRLAQARADTETRRWHLAETLWQARAELRRALVARALAQRSVTLAENEVTLNQNFLDWVETQIRFGAGVGQDRLTAQSNLARAQVQLRTSRGDLATAEAQIASAAGIAVENLPLDQLAPLDIDALPEPDTNDIGALRELGVVNRLTVRHALADYTVTEEALRQAVAKQYPDVSIGPGYSFDRGDHTLHLGIGFTVPLLHTERDGIAEAVAVRSRAAAQFQAAQSQALGEIDTASARAGAAYAALTEAKGVEESARNAVAETERRLRAGAADRGVVLTSQLGLALAERASLDALRALTDALGSLEDGVQRPLWPVSRLALQRPDRSTPEQRP